MSQFQRRRREIKAEINIIPFLDVLLVLLLIFIATSPIITQSVKVDLPDTVQTENIDLNRNNPVILEVSAKNVYRLYVLGKVHSELAPDQVVELAREELARDPKTIFLVAGDKSVPYEDVVNSLNLLHQAGIKSVGLMTNSLPQK